MEGGAEGGSIPPAGISQEAPAMNTAPRRGRQAEQQLY